MPFCEGWRAVRSRHANPRGMASAWVLSVSGVAPCCEGWRAVRMVHANPRGMAGAGFFPDSGVVPFCEGWRAPFSRHANPRGMGSACSFACFWCCGFRLFLVLCHSVKVGVTCPTAWLVREHPAHLPWLFMHCLTGTSRTAYPPYDCNRGSLVFESAAHDDQLALSPIELARWMDRCRSRL